VGCPRPAPFIGLHRNRRLPRPARDRDGRVLFSKEYAGFQVAIPVGLLVSAVFAAASAFVDVRPGIAAASIRRRPLLRYESLAPPGGVLIGAETYEQLPDGTLVRSGTGLRIKGKDDVVNAYVLLALP
jgi:hypothetical protein